MITKEIIADSLKQPELPNIRQRSFAEVLAEKEKAANKQEAPAKPVAEAQAQVTEEAPKVTTEQKPIVTEAKETPPEDQIQKLLRELDIKSIDELKEKVKPTPAKSKDQELSEALDYGIRNQKLKMEDYNEAVKLAAIPPKELVYKKFAETLKDKNSKITDEQIQKKFNNIYGEEVETSEFDADGNPITQIKFDEEMLQSEAEKIIKSAWQPIKDVQKDYTDYTTKEQQSAAIRKEAEAIKPQIPNAVKWNFGESEFEYTIDDSFKEKIQNKVIENFIATRQYMIDKGIKSDEQFDIAEATRYAVQNECFNNILLAHAATFANQRVEKELHPFKNPVTDKTLEMANQTGKQKVFTEDPIAAADRIAKLVRR